ncbi:MAG: hypothetical protein PHG48_07615 [Eubacteriales bacterium]|nr:hypothetical protein [Eubacteriales bacterium]
MIAKKPKILLPVMLIMTLILAAAVGCTFTGASGNVSPDDLFAVSTGNIHDYMPDLLAGEPVSDYYLLPCLEDFTHSTWSDLDEAYGPGWWNPLWTALHKAAISEAPADNYDQSMRIYYTGKAYLASDGAYAEGLADIILLQWESNPVIYSSCLSERFSAEDATSLRRSLTYSVRDSVTTVGLSVPGGNWRSIYLTSYPVDFPFGFDLTEKSRKTFRAESFGQTAIVESEGLQVTFLTHEEGVYTVITIRASGKDFAVAGIKIGDTEKSFLEHWPYDLKKLDSISYDDSSWFDKYDFAYSYTPSGRTKSVVIIIKDGLVSGIELIDGLDGAMY